MHVPKIAIILLALATAEASATPPQSAGHVTGVGGIFVKSHDPKALAAWYRDMLGVAIEPWGGAALRTDTPGHPSVVAWNALPERTTYMAPSTRDFMLDFAVDDMDALLARLRAHGVVILKRDDSDPSGKFAWIVDPTGRRSNSGRPRRRVLRRSKKGLLF